MATENIQMKEIKLFYCYAHEDKFLCDELDMHLKALQRGYDIKVHRIQDWFFGGGQEYAKQPLGEADIILLLISATFMNSDFFSSSIVNEITQRSEQDRSVLVPILLSQCQWQETPFAQLDILPRNHVPIQQWSDRDEAFCNVAQEIRCIVKNRSITYWKDWADALYRQKSYEEALAVYDRILRFDPGNLAAAVCKGNVCLDLHRYEEALQAYEQASLHRSTLEDVEKDKGDTSREEQHSHEYKGTLQASVPKSTLEELKKDQEDSSREAQWYKEALQVCIRILQQGSPYGSLSDHPLEIIPRDFPNYALHQGAIDEIDVAIQRNPINPFLYYIKGNIYFGLGRYEEALGAYEQSIHLKRDLEVSRYRFSEAVESISKQVYQGLHLLARQAVEEAHRLRDSDF